MHENVRKFVLACFCPLMFFWLCSAYAVGLPAEGQEESADTSALKLSLKKKFLFENFEWQLGECFLGFGDVERSRSFQVLVVGEWISDEPSLLIFRISLDRQGAWLAGVHLFSEALYIEESPLYREVPARDCSALEAWRGKVFEVLTVPPERAARLAGKLLRELEDVSVPVVQDFFVLHADSIMLFATSVGGGKEVFVSIAPPSPSLARWLHRFYKVLSKEGVKTPVARKGLSPDSEH